MQLVFTIHYRQAENSMGPAALGQIIDETIRRILTVVQAKRIFLFGSAARGTMLEHSGIEKCEQSCFTVEEWRQFGVTGIFVRQDP